MKKELNSKNKRKWMLGGVLLFGGVALLTTGFATWVIGVNRTSQSNNANVTVNGTENESVKLTVEFSNSDITVSEKHTKGPNEIIGTKNDDPETDFNLSFTITIEAGADYLKSTDINSVTFDWGKGATENSIKDENIETNVTANNVVASANKTYLRDNGENYTYLDFVEKTFEVNEEEWTKSNTTSTTKWVRNFENYKMFKWGTFFDNKSPCTFYNEKYKGGEGSLKDTDEHINAVYEELTVLKTAFMYTKDNGNTYSAGNIVIDAKLDTSAK